MRNWRISLLTSARSLTSAIDVDARDSEGCHGLPPSRNSIGQNKMVIIKFVNRKYAEAMLKDKKRISSKNFGYLKVTNRVFVSVSLCPYYKYIWDKITTCKGKGRFTMFLYRKHCLYKVIREWKPS